MGDARGEEIKFELSSADITTAAALILYTVGKAVRVLAGTEQLFITDIVISSATAMTVDVYDGTGAAPAAGERVVNVVTSATIGSIVSNQGTPIPCKRGVTPKAKASAAGQITITGTGFILKA